jgi:hypothetical protein
MCFDDAGGIDYNALIYGRAYPTAISGTWAFYEGLVASGIPVDAPSWVDDPTMPGILFE